MKKNQMKVIVAKRSIHVTTTSTAVYFMLKTIKKCTPTKMTY